MDYYGINWRKAIWVAVLAFGLAGALMLRLGYSPVPHAVATLAGLAVAAPVWIKGAA